MGDKCSQNNFICLQVSNGEEEGENRTLQGYNPFTRFKFKTGREIGKWWQADGLRKLASPST